MGRAKRQMFGKGPHVWPELERRVLCGQFLAIEQAYAQLHATCEEEALELCQILSQMRAGYLTDLPKHQSLIETIVSEVKRLNHPMPAPPPPLTATFNTQQKRAIETAFLNRLSIIAGGPGTGKTYVAAALLRVHRGLALVGAPTAKAAAQLVDRACGQGGTLHRLLGIRGPLDWMRPPEPLHADLILVDECSMVDPALFARLLSATPETTRLVLMGDPDQLPAVEGGSIFADLIRSETIPTTTLKACMRSDRTDILDLAAAVRSGSCPDMRTLDLGFTSGCIATIYERLLAHVRGRDFSRFRILSTRRKGPLGVDALNRLIHEELGGAPTPILINRKDPRQGLVNGDTGVIEGDCALMAGGRVIPISQLPSYEWAYCLSVHQAQGDEFEQVLLLVPEGSEAFGREVLYTGITRARTTLDIDGDAGEIARALSHSTLKPSAVSDLLQMGEPAPR